MRSKRPRSIKRKIHAVVDMHGDVDVSRQDPQRQGRGVPDAQRGPPGRREEQEQGAEEQVHGQHVTRGNYGAKHPTRPPIRGVPGPPRTVCAGTGGGPARPRQS